MCRAALILVLTSACAATPRALEPADYEADAPWSGGEAAEVARSAEDSGRQFRSASYHLTWRGERIGQAQEVFQRTDAGVRLIRRENVRVRRDGVVVNSTMSIVIDADEKLRARRVELRATTGAVERSGHATRADDGSWVLALEGEPVRTASRDAMPIELVPYFASSAGKQYNAEVFLAGYGFAVTQLRLRREGRRAVATLSTPWGEVQTSLGLARDGSLLRASTGATSSRRVSEARLGEPFKAPDLLVGSTIPLSGRGQALVLDHSRSARPLSELGQTATFDRGRWWVRYRRTNPGETGGRRVAELASISRTVNEMLTESNDAPGAGAGPARALGRGDCTAHAALFAELADKQGFETRLVTGYRVDGEQLVRHRWAAVRDNGEWIAVDPTFDEAPARPGRHLALAMHGGSVSELSLVDEVVFNGLTRATARWR